MMVIITRTEMMNVFRLLPFLFCRPLNLKIRYAVLLVELYILFRHMLDKARL